MPKSKEKTKVISLTIRGKTPGELQGRIIMILRLNKCLTQKQLAEIIGRDKSSIQRAEKKGTNSIAIYEIARALDVPPETFDIG